MKTRKIIITTTTDEISGLNNLTITSDNEFEKFNTAEVIGILEWAKANFIKDMAELGAKKLSEAHFANVVVRDAIKEAEKD